MVDRDRKFATFMQSKMFIPIKEKLVKHIKKARSKETTEVLFIKFLFLCIHLLMFAFEKKKFILFVPLFVDDKLLLFVAFCFFSVQ